MFSIPVFEGAGYNVNTITAGAYEIKSLDKKNKRFIIEEGYITQKGLPFKIKRIFRTLGCIIDIMPCGRWQVNFVQDHTFRDLLNLK